jgi:hypothetical protein
MVTALSWFTGQVRQKHEKWIGSLVHVVMFDMFDWMCSEGEVLVEVFYTIASRANARISGCQCQKTCHEKVGKIPYQKTSQT